MNPTEYWSNNVNLEHITPRGNRFHEVDLFLALQRACHGHVFELGCGDGRLAPAFSSDSYTGMDINPTAIKKAQDNNPEYQFTHEWVDADTILAYTVLLHISDEDLPAIVDKMQNYPRIVIGEIMGRSWRRSGNPPVFNRERFEYEAIFGKAREIIRVPYPRYATNLELCVWY